jgi:hypothetical protein
MEPSQPSPADASPSATTAAAVAFRCEVTTGESMWRRIVPITVLFMPPRMLDNARSRADAAGSAAGLSSIAGDVPGRAEEELVLSAGDTLRRGDTPTAAYVPEVQRRVIPES